MASVGGLAPLEAVSNPATRTVIYQVKGFTCITCATGLDTLLSQQKGIASSKSTYPEGKVTIAYHPNRITEQAIVAFIADRALLSNNPLLCHPDRSEAERRDLWFLFTRDK
jgi:copper chaperone CopZ